MSDTTSTANKKTLFVTVGTTLFQELVDHILQPSCLQTLETAGYTHLIIQYGKGTPPDITANTTRLIITVYDFRPSLQDDMKQAHAIVCHAGAGTLTEALQLAAARQKIIITVINARLMDNHQTELAHALQSRGYLVALERPELLAESLEDILKRFTPKVCAAGQSNHFVTSILNPFCGVKE